jgi:beta-fructofuranosidase
MSSSAVPRRRSEWTPQYHITSERNWMNDPNGPVHWQGTYHLFFQANPDAPIWGPPRWGHVSSEDLVTWRRHRIALEPSRGGPDQDGCWSGCTRVVAGRPVIYYTGVVGDGVQRVESVCRAFGSDDLMRWDKDPDNPLIPGPPPALGSGYHRDPFLWQDEQGWHLILGSGTSRGDRHGRVLHYRSDEARIWEYEGVLFEASRRLDGLDLGEHWECPQLLRFGDRWILIVSSQDPAAGRPLLHAVYFVGRLEDGVFRGELKGRVDWGDVFYAPTVLVDQTGRQLVWGWIQEHVSEGVQTAMTKVGALSLPRVADLVDDELRLAPAPEIDALRTEAAPQRRTRVVADDGAVPLGQPSRHFEVQATIHASAGRAGFEIDLSPDGEEMVRVFIDGDRQLLVLDRSQASRDPRVPSSRIEARLPNPRSPWRLRVFRDGSILEMFISDRLALTTRVYPTSEQPGHTRAFCSGGDVTLDHGVMWSLSTPPLSPRDDIDA